MNSALPPRAQPLGHALPQGPPRPPTLEPCRYFSSKDGCIRGAACIFPHSDSPSPLSPASYNNQLPSAPVQLARRPSKVGSPSPPPLPTCSPRATTPPTYSFPTSHPHQNHYHLHYHHAARTPSYDVPPSFHPYPDNNLNNENLPSPPPPSEADDETLEMVLSGRTRVLFGPGGRALAVHPQGAESRIVIAGFPPNTSPETLTALLSPYVPVLDPEWGVTRTGAWAASIVVEDGEVAKDVVSAVKRRGELGGGVCVVSAKIVGMAPSEGTPYDLPGTSLLATWELPPRVGCVTFRNRAEAERAAAALDGALVLDRPVRCRFSASRSGSFGTAADEPAVELANLPAAATQRHIAALFSSSSGAADLFISGIYLAPAADPADTGRALVRALAVHGPLDEFTIVETTALSVSAAIRFADPRDAARALAYVHNADLAGVRVALSPLHATRFILPRDQFSALERDLDDIRATCDASPPSAPIRFDLTWPPADSAPAGPASIRLSSPDPTTLLYYQRMLDHLLAGDLLVDPATGSPIWDTAFTGQRGAGLLKSIGVATHSHIYRNSARRTLSILGAPTARRAAAAALYTTFTASLARHIIPLPP
ncbi:hypothetical protein BDK51DRAFT_47086, partial [Blyttiomyces helicus]